MPHDDFNKIDEEYFDTILDEDFHFEGTIKHDNSLIVKGHIKGKIETKGDLIVGPKAVIDASINSKALQCFGKINGNIQVENEAVFHYPSSLRGNITTSVLTFEKGCFLNGMVSMKNPDEKTFLKEEVKI